MNKRHGHRAGRAQGKLRTRYVSKTSSNNKVMRVCCEASCTLVKSTIDCDGE